MKGIQGLIIAVILGVVAAFFNWAYLKEKSKNTEMVYFIGVADNQTIARGEKFTKEKLVKVGFPKDRAASMKDFAVHWKDVDGVTQLKSPRLIPERQLLLDQDLDMPATTLAKADVDRIWVTLDSQAIMTQQISPGDQISFIVSAPRLAQPLGSGAGAGDDPSVPTVSTARTRNIGPFLVLSLGNRLGRPETARKGGVSRASENVIGIKVTLDAAGSLDRLSQTLMDALHATNSRPLGVVLHAKDADEARP